MHMLILLLTGVLFISFNADYRVLYQPLTEKSVEDAMQYYKTFYNAPKAVLVSAILRQ
jgi:ER membrane protein SH3